MLRLVGPSEQWGKLRDLQKCAPRQLLVIRGSSITSAGDVAGFLGVIQVVIVMGFDMCLMETACTDCFSVAILSRSWF